ncbi:MAG: hypothetical protein FWF69_09570 [Firmicutes bacterium]|nr:hypothetical protein [Bacillota bacterium]
MAKYPYGAEMPMGLGMALAQNLDAFTKFASLSMEQKRAVIERTHGIGSKEEMQAFVDSMFA